MTNADHIKKKKENKLENYHGVPKKRTIYIKMGAFSMEIYQLIIVENISLCLIMNHSRTKNVNKTVRRGHILRKMKEQIRMKEPLLANNWKKGLITI